MPEPPKFSVFSPIIVWSSKKQNKTKKMSIAYDYKLDELGNGKTFKIKQVISCPMF